MRLRCRISGSSCIGGRTERAQESFLSLHSDTTGPDSFHAVIDGSDSDLDSLFIRIPHSEVWESRSGVPVPLNEALEDAAQLRPGEAERQAREVLPTAKQLPVHHRGHSEALLPPEKS